jgi:hypothetical protein
MENCASLKNINVEKLTSLTSVGNCWMKGCSSLQLFSMETLDNLRIVGSQWLMDCSSLRMFYANNKKSLLSIICNNWMKNCTRLVNVNVRGLFNLLTIGEDSMSGCDMDKLEIEQNSAKYIMWIDQDMIMFQRRDN